MKVVVSDTETGRAYNIELDERKVGSLLGKKIGDEVDASPIGLAGYKIKITGGSDKDGFPMRHDIHSRGRPKILLSQGPGYRPKAKGIKRRKRVRGCIITPDILQVNAKIVKKGKKGIEEQLGGFLGEKKEEGVKEVAKVEKKAEDEKKEEVKESMKVKEDAKKIDEEAIEKEKIKIEEKKEATKKEGLEKVGKKEKKKAIEKEVVEKEKADKPVVEKSEQKEKTSTDSKGKG